MAFREIFNILLHEADEVFIEIRVKVIQFELFGHLIGYRTQVQDNVNNIRLQEIILLIVVMVLDVLLSILDMRTHIGKHFDVRRISCYIVPWRSLHFPLWASDLL